jgi:hypothetical protein
MKLANQEQEYDTERRETSLFSKKHVGGDKPVHEGIAAQEYSYLKEREEREGEKPPNWRAQSRGACNAVTTKRYRSGVYHLHQRESAK